MTEADDSKEIRLLRDELRDLRRQGDVYGSGDTIHQLRNYVAAAESAIQVVEAPIGQDSQFEVLLELARLSLRRGRALVARLQRRLSIPLGE